jgi:hypothetical protein
MLARATAPCVSESGLNWSMMSYTQDFSVQPEHVALRQTSLRIDERQIDLRERATEIEPLSALAPFVGCCEQLGQHRRSLRVAIAQPDPHRCGVPQLGTHAEIAHDALLPHLSDSQPNAQSRGHAGTQGFPFLDSSSQSNRSSTRSGSPMQRPAADPGQRSQPAACAILGRAGGSRHQL